MKGFTPLFLGIFGDLRLFLAWARLHSRIRRSAISIRKATKRAPTFIRCRNPEWPSAAGAFTPRTAASIATANRSAPIMPLPISIARATPLQVRPKWGDRRSAPRDYIFDRPALLGKMRMGPDLANIGKAAPAEEEAAPAQPGPANPAAPVPRRPQPMAHLRPQTPPRSKTSSLAAQPSTSDSTCGPAARRECLSSARKRRSPTKRQHLPRNHLLRPRLRLATANCRSPFARCVTFRLPGGLLRCLASSTSLCAAQFESRFEHAGL